MQFLNPGGAWAFLALAGVIALYLLRRRYVETPVSSTLLWQKALADLSASTPFKRLKKSLLLIMQLIMALILALIIMRPALVAGQGGDIVLIFDVSGSMQADDGGLSRLDRCIIDARRIVEGMGPNDRVSILTSGAATRQMASRVNDRQRALGILRELRAENGAADLTQALSIARALEKEAGQVTTVVYTDMTINASSNTVSPFSGADNRRVVSLATAERAGANKALAQIANYGEMCELTVECLADGEICDAGRLILSEGETGSITFDIPPDAKIIKAEIVESDALNADNAYTIALHGARDLPAALASQGNIFLEKALALREDIVLTRASADEAAATGGFALYVFDGEMPENPPADGAVMLFSTAGAVENPQSVSLAATAPIDISRNLTLEGVAVRAYQPLSRGTEVLTAGGDAIMTIREENGRAIAEFGFDLHDSNLPLKSDFPILMRNLLDYLLPQAAAGADDALCGRIIELFPDPRATSATIVTPSGREVALPYGQRGFHDTNEIGVYTLRQNVEDEIFEDFFAVNMPLSESDLRYVPSSGGVQAEIHRSAAASRELTPYLIAALLALLIAEWWIYRRSA